MTAVPLQAPFSGTIEQWLVEDGEDIHVGEELVIITLEGRSVTVFSETEGSVKSILHAEGEVVLSGWKLAIIEEIDAALSALENAMTKDSEFINDIKKVVEEVVVPRFDEVNAKLDLLIARNGGTQSSVGKPKSPKR